MASQLASDVRSCQRLMHCAASYGERGSGFTLSHPQTFGYHRIRENRGVHPAEGNFREHNMGPEKSAKRSKKLDRQQAQKLHRLGFSYLASSFLYIVTKVKAFYNGFASESRMGVEAPMAEPYFSVPVLPY